MKIRGWKEDWMHGRGPEEDRKTPEERLFGFSLPVRCVLYDLERIKTDPI